MFTPQRKGWSVSPRIAASGDGRSKGKAVVDEALPPPPTASLEGNGPRGGGGGGDAGDWTSFRDAGFLDKSALQRRDREALVGRIAELEKEWEAEDGEITVASVVGALTARSSVQELLMARTLHEYQYNMGILLIEKNEWSSKYEDMRQGLATAEEILKREQTAHLIAASEFEKRETNIMKALGVEKQCVADLEKALREMRAEVAEVKFTSDKKLTDVHALEASIEEKYLEIEGKLRSADAKLAEASRKSAEIDRKLEDVESRERKLQRELMSLNTERKVHEKDLAEQREYLQDWEKKLQEGQKRLVDGQRSLNGREDRAAETDRILKKKEEDIEEKRREIEVTRNSLKDKEDDIEIRLRALASKEKDAEIKMENLAKKEKDLLALEDDLTVKERVGLQKLLDDHNAILDEKKREFDLEMEQKRKLFAEELKGKLDAVEKKKAEIERKEEQTIKREQVLESKTEKLKIKEKDLNTKSKALKNWEDSLKVDEKTVKEERKQLGEHMQELLASKAGLEHLKAEIEAEKQQIAKEKEGLKLTKEEREQHTLLQSKLKQEIEEYGKLKESVITESESLRLEKEKFEMEWEVLDEKRMALEAEQKQVTDERCRFEKWRHSEELRLKNEGLELNANIKRELEDLRLKKEAFESTMEHEHVEAREALKRERADIARELELRKHELEMNMQKKQEDMEKKLREREAEFDRRREVELNDIKSSSDLNESKIRRLKVEQDRLEREKEQLSLYEKKLESDKLEIQKDIDTLRVLSRNLKDQREEFSKERDRFLAQVEQYQVCKNCGVQISELQTFGIQPLKETQDAGNVLLPSLADGFLEERLGCKSTEASPQITGSHPVNSAGRMSWLQKCSRLFKISPGKRSEYSADAQDEKYTSFGSRLDRADSEGEADYESAPSYDMTKDSSHTHRVQLDTGTRGHEELERLDRAGDEPEPSLGITDNSVDVMKNTSDHGIREREDEHNIPSVHEHNEVEGSLPKNDSQPQPSKQQKRQPSRRGRGGKTIRRTRSVKAVVEDAKAILGKASDSEMDGHQNGDAVDSLNAHEESLGDSVHTNQLATSGRQKRRLAYTDGASDLDAEDSEARSESVSLGGRRKRQNISTLGGPTPGEKRYNFRRSTIAGSAVAAQATSDQNKGLKKGSQQQVLENDTSKADSYADEEGISKHRLTVGEDRKVTTNMMQKSNVETVLEIQEISSQKLVRFETEEVRVECGDNIEGGGEVGEEVDIASADVATTPSRGGYGSSEGEDDDDYEDEEEFEEHNASIGKKIFRFFTS